MQPVASSFAAQGRAATLSQRQSTPYALPGNPCRPAGSDLLLSLKAPKSGSRYTIDARKKSKIITCGTNLSLIETLEKVVPPKYYESDKEQSRVYRQTVFGHDDWFKHRSTRRYLRHLSGMFESRVVRSLSWPVGWVVVNSSILVSYEWLRTHGYLPPFCGSLVVGSAEPFNLTSFALSLLLVFRTNASYARWAEARAIWGAVTNRSRDIARQGFTWFSPEKENLIGQLERWAISFPYALKCHLTYNSDLEADLKHVLNKEEMEGLLSAKHRPNYVERMMTEVIYAAKLSDMETFLMDGNLTSFSDDAGKCERIFKTPIPLSWTRHTSRFLMLWLTFLPYILYRNCNWLTPFVGALISVSLLAVDEIGVSLEEPFGILPLGNMCEGIEGTIKEMSSQRKDCSALVQGQLPRHSGGAGSSEGIPAADVSKQLSSALQNSGRKIL